MSKQPLILLPGLLCDAALWAHQAEGLADVADVRVADLTTHRSMAGLARAVLDGAPDTFALAGLSMGGYVAQEILRQAPRRVSRLALVDTNARADMPEQSERRRAMMTLAQGGKLDAVARQMLAALVHPDRLEDPLIRDAWLGMAERIGLEGYINQQTAILNRVDGRADLGAVTCPALVLCGADDQLTPPEVHEEMAAAIGENAELVVVDDCGHLSPLERPDAVNAAFRAWLERG
ncbi:MAG: alpha/beta hydrolase [Alphaproteobacteria bacterium]|nr:alpha/beta hydrolase [Alphaproteobacteria bacterium]MBF0251130.1 alpha/beta hydrolase [Alphaproteobacteria bacterium]